MLLAIDTSGPLCSAALLDGDIAYERSDDIGRGHAEHLMGLLEALLDDAGAGWASITRIACSTGPGSFTGLRVGLATARGLALALERPCVGVTVFEAFAEQYGDGVPLCVAMDARRDQLWMQVFSADGVAHSAPFSIAVEQAMSAVPPEIKRLAGSGSSLLSGESERFEILNTAGSPPIVAVAKVAAQIYAEEDADAAPPAPLYLRAPDAKPQQVSL